MLQEALDLYPGLAVEIVDRVNSTTPPAQVPTVNEENTSWFPALGSSVRSTHTHSLPQNHRPTVKMTAILDSPKPRINCSMLSQYISKAVCLVGRVDKVSDANG